MGTSDTNFCCKKINKISKKKKNNNILNTSCKPTTGESEAIFYLANNKSHFESGQNIAHWNWSIF